MTRHQDLRDEIAELTDAVITRRAVYSAWARPLIDADRQLTQAETAEHDRATAELDDLDTRLRARARELVTALAAEALPGLTADALAPGAPGAPVTPHERAARVRKACGEDTDLLTFVDVIARVRHGEQPTPYELAICRSVPPGSLVGFLERLEPAQASQ
jgi:hypothetical protein